MTQHRMTPERLAKIRADIECNKIISGSATRDLLAELDAVTRERDDLHRYAMPDYNRFQEWAQSVLDGGRWAGHSRVAAIIAEWHEREAYLSVTRERDEARKDDDWEDADRWRLFADSADREQSSNGDNAFVRYVGPWVVAEYKHDPEDGDHLLPSNPYEWIDAVEDARG